MGKLLRFKITTFIYLITMGLYFLCASSFASYDFQPVFNPSLEIKKADEPIKIDGKINDPAWNTASRADNFVERMPGDKTKPEVETEAFVTYDDDNLYVAFLCYDNPSSIRATMCQRDQFYSDDAVCLLIDTYGNAAWAYEFFVNPYGIQKDLLWSSVSGEDRGFDLIWKSAAEITDSGYQVEIAIPFASMRFPNKEDQTWKVDFWRFHPRKSFSQYSWAAYDRDEQCWACQWGTVNGIKNVYPGKGFEIMPTIIGNQSGMLSDFNNPDSPFENEKVDGELSIGAKYTISSSITAEGTYNPDFSQIEADADQIDVNTTIALFYPERRPFFQEGSDIFRTIFNSFYTRTVNDPQFAAKFTGRMNNTSVGFLTAVDENTPYIIPLEESSRMVNSGKSYVNILRASRSFGEDSRFGLIVTDRRFDGGGSGTVLGLDGDLRLTQNYSVVGQFITSFTEEPDDSILSINFEDIMFNNDKHTAALDGESFSGNAFITQLRRHGRNWHFTLDYNQVAPSYRTETGYDPWNDYRNLSIFSLYTFYLDKGIFEQISPHLYTDTRWNYDNKRKWANFNFNIDADLRLAQTNLEIALNRSVESWSGQDFNDLWRTTFFMNSRFSDKIGHALRFSYGKNVARWLLEKGNETTFYISLNVKPIDRLIIEPNFDYSKSTQVDTGEELYKGYITRTRFRYQANRELSIRLVIQYNDFYETWDIDPLLTYRISPFSVFYIGSTHDLGNISDISGGQSQWRQTSRQFFMKLQYLFRT